MITTVYRASFLRKADIALRTGIAALLCAVVISLHATNSWMVSGFFAEVIAILICDATLGRVIRNAWSCLWATVASVGLSVACREALGPSYPAMMGSLAVSCLLFAYPRVHLLGKKVAIALCGILYLQFVHDHSLGPLHAVRLGGVTMVGAVCALVAIVLPLPRPQLASIEVERRAHVAASCCSLLHAALSNAFAAADEGAAGVIQAHAAMLAHAAEENLAMLRERAGDLEWEVGFRRRHVAALRSFIGTTERLLLYCAGMQRALQGGHLADAPLPLLRGMHAPLAALSQASSEALVASLSSLTHKATPEAEAEELLARGGAALSGFHVALRRARILSYYKSASVLEEEGGKGEGKSYEGESKGEDEGEGADFVPPKTKSMGSGEEAKDLEGEHSLLNGNGAGAGTEVLAGREFAETVANGEAGGTHSMVGTGTGVKAGAGTGVGSGTAMGGGKGGGRLSGKGGWEVEAGEEGEEEEEVEIEAPGVSMVAAQFFLFNAQQFAAEVLRLLECQAGTSAEVSLRQRLGRRWGIPPVDWLSASVGGIWTRAYPDADDTASVMDGEDDGNVTADEEDDLMGGGAAAEEAEVERDIEACHVAPLEIAGGKQLGPASTNGQTNGSMTGVTKAEAGGRGRSGGPTGLRQFCRPIFAARFMWQRMRLWLRIGTWRKQLLPAVRVSIACTVAGAIGTGFIEDFGFWAVVTVAFIIGGNQGGAFRAASLRLQVRAMELTDYVEYWVLV
eukprot:jgi/Mesen1/1231/ME000129S00333